METFDLHPTSLLTNQNAWIMGLPYKQVIFLFWFVIQFLVWFFGASETSSMSKILRDEPTWIYFIALCVFASWMWMMIIYSVKHSSVLHFTPFLYRARVCFWGSKSLAGRSIKAALELKEMESKAAQGGPTPSSIFLGLCLICKARHWKALHFSVSRFLPETLEKLWRCAKSAALQSLCSL